MFDTVKNSLGSNWPQRTPTLNIEWGQVDPKGNRRVKPFTYKLTCLCCNCFDRCGLQWTKSSCDKKGTNDTLDQTRGWFSNSREYLNVTLFLIQHHYSYSLQYSFKCFRCYRRGVQNILKQSRRNWVQLWTCGWSGSPPGSDSRRRCLWPSAAAPAWWEKRSGPEYKHSSI